VKYIDGVKIQASWQQQQHLVGSYDQRRNNAWWRRKRNARFVVFMQLAS
jgi:hypothetical protein